MNARSRLDEIGDRPIVESIRTCLSLIFVMTIDCFDDESGSKNEWTRASKYKKPIIHILLHEEAEIPFQLENPQYIDFTGDFKSALAKLRKHIQWLDSSEGKLRASFEGSSFQPIVICIG